MELNTIRKKPRYFILLFLLPAVLIYGLFAVMPIINSMFMSLYTGEGLIPNEFVGFENYVKLFTASPFKERFLNAFINNIQYFFMVLVFQNLGGFIIAILVTKKFIGSTFFRRVSFLPVTVSIFVSGWLFRILFNPYLGIVDKILKAIGLDFLIRPWLGDASTILPIIAIIASWQYIGMLILLYASGIDNMDSEVIEAAAIDGANQWGMVRHIIAPLLVAVFKIVLVLQFIGNFTGFALVYAVATTQGDPKHAADIFGTLYYRTAFASPAEGGWGTGMGAAVATIMFIFIGVVVLALLAAFRRKELLNN